MKTNLVLLIFGIFFVCLSSFETTRAQTFTTEKIADKIFLLVNPDDEDQLVILSKKGIVVFNTFWSEITARKYKDEISKAFNRDDFYLTVNMVDRLDMFGGNAAYKETIIIGHNSFLAKYEGKEEEVNAEITGLIEMWRWKENVSRERLKTHEPGSEREIAERSWMNTCKKRANELEQGFSLVLPTEVYQNRKTLDLGDITLELIWFGRAGVDGMTIVWIPEEKLAIIPGFIMHTHHLAPHPQPHYAKLDVARWIDVLGEILEGQNPVERVVCDINNIWPRERAHTHLVYIRNLWNSVKKAEAAGKSLDEIQDQLSLDNEFAFVKEMYVYKVGGDDWIRPQHKTHVRMFFLQHKNLASEILKKKLKDSPQTALAHIRKLRDSDADVYFEEASINGLGYNLMNSSRFTEAIDVFKLNVELFPSSANVYDSLAEAYMKSGETQQAIKNYKKSIELNPDNNNAKEKLKMLEEK